MLIRKPARRWKIPARRVKHASRAGIAQAVIVVIVARAETIVVRVVMVVEIVVHAVMAAVIAVRVPSVQKAETPTICRRSSSLTTELSQIKI